MASHPSLDTLPLELRERIVSFGSYANLLQISLTNRALYQACKSLSVTKAILHNHNGCGGRKWRYPCLPAEAPVSDWARYALADLKATQTMSNIDGLSRYDGTMLWAPQLTVLQHPFTANTTLNVPRLWMPPNRLDPYLDIVYFFCVVMQILLPDHAAVHVIPPPAEGTASARRQFIRSLSRTVGNDVPHHSKEHTLEAASNAYIVLAYFVRDLRVKLATETPQRTWDGFVHQNSQSPLSNFAVPNSHSIPFTEFMDLPLPFTDDSPSKFATCHLRKMINVSFFEDGSEWGGYYSLSFVRFQRTRTEVEFDPPMHNVRFTAEWCNDVVLRVDGTGGSDGVGTFTLRGTIAADTGALSMEKIYANHGPRWRWVGFLTPFGVIASWGAGEADSWGGWVWLYKTAWSPKGAS